jgi:hypothetical protein
VFGDATNVMNDVKIIGVSQAGEIERTAVVVAGDDIHARFKVIQNVTGIRRDADHTVGYHFDVLPIIVGDDEINPRHG